MEYKAGHTFELKGGAYPGVYKVECSLGHPYYGCGMTTYPYIYLAVREDEIQKASSSNELPYNHRY